MNWLLNKMYRGFGKRDETNPLVRAYRHLFHRLVVLAVIGVVLFVLALAVGVPHAQTTYSYRGPTPSGGIVKSRQKIAANYLGPFGWQRARSGQYGNDGCPFILFIPLFDCFD